MKRLLILVCLLAAAGGGIFWAVTRPAQIDPGQIAGLVGDARHGETVFWAGGCAACHAADKAEGTALLVLSGGKRLVSPFGTFIVPNISPDPVQGIGTWSATDLVNAMLHGTSPGGEHYYPAFPYPSYSRANVQDIVDLKAYLDTLPPSDRPDVPHELPFPVNQRLLLGGWKLLFLSAGPLLADPDLTPAELRGRELVEGLGHCGECHTPRNLLGGPDRARWLAGAPNPDGKGKTPNITPAKLTWSEAEIADYLATGFTPEFDSAGGAMAEVIGNTAKLPPEDRAAIAAYLKRVPATN